jgi:alpha/beta superfamily hydrolase
MTQNKKFQYKRAVVNGQIITFYTSDGLGLKAYLATCDDSIATIVHVHGSCGNFYENAFIPTMAQLYTNNRINFLSFNNRGHDCIAEAYQNGNLVYIGGSYEKIEQCQLDIEGAIKYVQNLGPRIVIQGHSFGCQKVLYYLKNAVSNYDFALLSPADTYRLQINNLQFGSVEDQIARIEKDYVGRMDTLLPPEEFGIRGQGVEYSIPITPRSLIGTLKSPVIKLLNYREAPNYFINSRAFICYGNADPLWTETPETVKTFFSERVKKLTFYICNKGDHHFHGFEELIAKEIIKWVKNGNKLERP